MSTNVSPKTMEQIRDFMLRKNVPITAGQLSRLRGGTPKHNREILNEMVKRGLINERSNPRDRYYPSGAGGEEHVLKVYYIEESTPDNNHELGVVEAVSRLVGVLSGLENTRDIDWMNGGWQTPEEALFTLDEPMATVKPDALLKVPVVYGDDTSWYRKTLYLYAEYDRSTKSIRLTAEQMFRYAVLLDRILYCQWNNLADLGNRHKLVFITVNENQAKRSKAALEQLAEANRDIYGDILSRVDIWITWAGEINERGGTKYWYSDVRWDKLGENIWMRAGCDKPGFFLDEKLPEPFEDHVLNRYRLADAEYRLAQSPYDGEALFEVGKLCFIMGDMEKAKYMFWDAENEGFESEDMFFMMGKVYSRYYEPFKDKMYVWPLRNKAKGYFERALEMNPDHEGSTRELDTIRERERAEEAARIEEERLIQEEAERIKEEAEKENAEGLWMGWEPDEVLYGCFLLFVLIASGVGSYYLYYYFVHLYQMYF